MRYLGEMINRAILLVGWGAKGTLDAERAVLRLPPDQQADIFIVADHDLTLDSRASLIRVDFKLPHTLRKAEGIVTHAPKGYDSVLYMDSDITLLDDVTYVFAKAEMHGIAMAIAPTYLLDEYRSFGEVLDREGVPRRGQVQYQAGLIAFSENARVREVFEKWLELGARHRDVWIRDQPQLSLAFEICGFQPFVLSKNYNLRGMFEPVIGKVRVWHNFAAIPGNVNRYEKPYPPRLLARHKIRSLTRRETHNDWLKYSWRQLITLPLYRLVTPVLRRVRALTPTANPK